MDANARSGGASGELQHPDSAAIPTEPDEASNPSAITSLVLGILALMIQLLAWGVWFIRSSQADAALERLLAGTGQSVQSPGVAGVSIWSAVSLVVAISAIVFGVKGRKLAKAEAPGRITATIGLVLGIVFVSIPILALLAFVAWVSCCVDTL